MIKEQYKSDIEPNTNIIITNIKTDFNYDIQDGVAIITMIDNANSFKEADSPCRYIIR